MKAFCTRVVPLTSMQLIYVKKQITKAAINLTDKSGSSQSGKNGCITYLANVSPIIALVVGLKIRKYIYSIS